MRLGWKLATSLPQPNRVFSNLFFGHQIISIFINGLCLSTTVIHSIHQSRVTGLPKLAKSHDCHGHFGKVMKPFLGSKNHLKMAQKIVKNRKKVNHCLFTLLIALHCGTHGAWKSYPGLAIYVIYFVPLWLESHNWVIHLWEIFCTSAVGKSYLSHPFMLDILYPYSWKIIWYIIPLWLENHTLVIHLHEIYCTFAVGKSSFKLWDPSNEFHEHLVLFHTPHFIHLGWISSYNRMIIISLGIFTYTILYGFIPLQLKNDMIYHAPAVRSLP